MKEKRGNGDRFDDRQRELIDAALREADSVRQRAQATASAPVSDSALVELASDSVTGYKIVRQIHRGGQGVVYLALQQSTGREVAMKVMKEGPFAGAADQARFDREVQVLGQLNHPNIVTIHDSGSAAGHHFFVMDYVPGQPLDVYMAGAQRSIDETLRLFGKICDAVNAAHLRGVIHRDLKPGNIRVDTTGEPRVLDFGLAKVATPLSPPLEGGDGGGVAAMTVTGQFVGSLPWASPEQAEGAPSKIDLRTDVYSLGVILYHMLTGRFPYDVMGNVRDVLDNIMTAEPVRPSVAAAGRSARAEARGSSTRFAFIASWLRRSVASSINDEVDTIVLKCLSKERERRYQTAGELGRDVQHYLAGEPIEAKRDSLAYVLRKQLIRHKVPVAIGAGFLVLLMAFSVFMTVMYQWSVAAEEQARLAEADTEERAKELEQVSEFQASQLREIDAQLMGVRLRRALLDAAPEPRREALEASLAGLNFTNLALGTLEDNIFQRTIDAIDEQFAEQPLLQARLLQTVATTLFNVGLWDEALDPQERALEIRRNHVGDDHPDTLTSINNMGTLLQAQGKLTEAERLCREALEGKRRVLGEDHVSTLRSIVSMGFLLRVMGKLSDAERYNREALEGRRRVLGDDHPETLEAINNMALLLQEQGRLAEAERYQREALEHERRVLGDDHPTTLTSIGNMGTLLLRMGKLEAAEPYCREALEGSRRLKGDDHPETLATINNLAVLLQDLGKLGEAEVCLREGLETARRVLGDDHPRTLTSISNMANLLAHVGKLEAAERYCREALEGNRRVKGDDHPETLTSISNMGMLLLHTGKLEAAEPYCREALEGNRCVKGDDHPETLASIANLGGLLHSMGKIDEAEPYFREAMERRSRILGEDHPSTLSSICNMSGLLLGMEKTEESEALGARAVRGARRSLPEGHPYTGLFLQGHARSLYALGRHLEAETALVEAHGILENALGAQHERTADAVKSLAILYETWDAAEPGQGYDAKAAEWRAKLPTPQP